MHDAAHWEVNIGVRGLFSAATVFLVLLVYASYKSQLHAAEVIPLRYAQAYSSLRSIFSLPIVIGDREGFFRREGLDFRVIVPIPGGADKMIDALHDDTADITHVATPFLIRAALAHSDAVAIAAEFNNPVYSLIAKPAIKTFADLKGKLVALADESGTITISTRKLLALHGLRAGDFRVKIIEGTPARFQCLVRGECDAAPLGQPQDFSAVEKGCRVLGLSTEAVPELLYTVTAARRSWAAAHKETLVRYARGLAAAFKFVRDPAKRPLIVKTIVETTDASAAAAEQTLKLYFEPERGVLPRQGEINIKGLDRVIEYMGQAGTLEKPLPTAERFVDIRYLAAAGLQ
ncbi:MAG TPA: ABC transporter substrate-binding protein [Verrucomicrobiae bacterium]|jgi:ABC-type nitrate/sulfonate/bicarbonate transport system substrate-binding protein|nr:ABC transporter substrate-binding protein [Verrucomicrobiae bacterium]